MARNKVVDHFQRELHRYQEELAFALSSPELRSAGASGELDGLEHVAHLHLHCAEYLQAIEGFG